MSMSSDSASYNPSMPMERLMFAMPDPRVRILMILVFLGLIAFPGWRADAQPSIESRALAPGNERTVLWYRAPADSRTGALPIGNGWLGGLVFGDAIRERVTLGDDSLWSKGSPGSHESLGELVIQYPRDSEHVTEYQRSLNMADGVVRVGYVVDGVRHRRESFVSAIDDVLVIHHVVDTPGALDLDVTMTRDDATMTRAMPAVTSDGTAAPVVALTGTLDDGAGMAFFAGAQVTADLDAITKYGEDTIRVRGASAVTICVTSATSYRDQNLPPAVFARLEYAAKKGIDAVRRDHLTDHRRLFNRVDFGLGSAMVKGVPTDERITRYRDKPDDRLLEVLLFQFGRYLLMATSRPGSMPIASCGVWGPETNDAATYRLGGSLSMSYWAAEVAALPECHRPVFDLMQLLVEPGTRVARDLYDAPGWALHDRTDAWMFAGPVVGSKPGLPLGAAWLSQHAWAHYEFTQEGRFLARNAYPKMKAATAFVADRLDDPAIQDDLTPADRVIVRNLLAGTIEASEVLESDPALRAEWKRLLATLSISDDDNDPHDVPVTTLQIDEFPETDQGTGGALAWRMNTKARHGDGEGAHRAMRTLIDTCLQPNLVNSNPRFHVDANLGLTAGVAEMLVQSRDGVIDLLPALPESWADGYVRGLRGRGGFMIDIAWADGEVTEAVIACTTGTEVVVRCTRGVQTVRLSPRRPMALDASSFVRPN